MCWGRKGRSDAFSWSLETLFMHIYYFSNRADGPYHKSNGSLISEQSLEQSRSKRIQEAMNLMYSEATKNTNSDQVLVTTADEDIKRRKAQMEAQKAVIESTINVILHVKRIKRDLHIQ